MKKLIFPILIASFLITCEEFKEVVFVDTETATDITSYSAKLNGLIVDPGEGIRECGHIWWRSGNQSITTKIALTDKRTGSFSCNLAGLEPATVYFIKAYATDGNELAYGDVLSFVTLDSSPVSGLPVLVTASVTSITSISAQSGGNITDDGGSPVTARGVCWGKTQSPTLSDYKTTDGAGTGSFTSNLTGLSPNTIYYFRAYATNSAGTAYGNQFSFTTPEEDPGTSCEIPAGIDAAFYRLPDGIALIVDGIAESAWNDVPAQPIDRNFKDEVPTVTAFWKGFWDDEYIYVMVNVVDDDHWPAYESGGAYEWEYDKVEVYFDINDVLEDNTGPGTVNSGHWQSAPILTDTCYGTENFYSGWVQRCVESYFSYNLDGESYVTEIKIPIQKMYDKDLTPLDAAALAAKTVGFDVTVVDQDEWISTGRTRKVWRNDGNSGGMDEAWNTMDACGKVIFCGGSGGTNNKPALTTNEVISVTSTTAKGGGLVSSEGDAPVTSRGICWSTNQIPTTTDEKAYSGSGTGMFTCNLTNLSPGTPYYVRAFAINSFGTAYGNQVSFTTSSTITQCTLPEGVGAVFKKLPADTYPWIDGIEEDIWDISYAYPIEKIFNNEDPTVSAYWKGLWDNENIYILVSVTDGDHWPAWESGGNSWEYDKPEIYFDINEELEDGLGPMTSNSGHWQVAPVFRQDESGIEYYDFGNGTSTPENISSYSLYGESYVFEYAIPLYGMWDNNQNTMDVDISVGNRIFGFDVCIIDQDEGTTTTRGRKVWQNDARTGAMVESWENMDECGRIIFCNE